MAEFNEVINLSVDVGGAQESIDSLIARVERLQGEVNKFDASPISTSFRSASESSISAIDAIISRVQALQIESRIVATELQQLGLMMDAAQMSIQSGLSASSGMAQQAAMAEALGSAGYRIKSTQAGGYQMWGPGIVGSASGSVESLYETYLPEYTRELPDAGGWQRAAMSRQMQDVISGTPYAGALQEASWNIPPSLWNAVSSVEPILPGHEIYGSARGGYLPSERKISLDPKRADSGTVLHEFGHLADDVLGELQFQEVLPSSVSRTYNALKQSAYTIAHDESSLARELMLSRGWGPNEVQDEAIAESIADAMGSRSTIFSDPKYRHGETADPEMTAMSVRANALVDYLRTADPDLTDAIGYGGYGLGYAQRQAVPRGGWQRDATSPELVQALRNSGWSQSEVDAVGQADLQSAMATAQSSMFQGAAGEAELLDVLMTHGGMSASEAQELIAQQNMQAGRPAMAAGGAVTQPLSPRFGTIPLSGTPPPTSSLFTPTTPAGLYPSNAYSGFNFRWMQSVTPQQFGQAWGQAGRDIAGLEAQFGVDMTQMTGAIPPTVLGMKGGEGLAIGHGMFPYDASNAQLQRTVQIMNEAEGSSNKFGDSILRTAGYFARWLIVWEVFEFITKSLAEMVQQAAALEETASRVAFIKGTSEGAATETILDQYQVAAQYGLGPTQVRGALTMGQSYGIDIGYAAQASRVFGIQPEQAVMQLQQARYFTGLGESDILNQAALMYKAAPGVSQDVLQIVAESGMLAQMSGIGSEQIGAAMALTGKEMGISPTQASTAFQRMATKIPEPMMGEFVQYMGGLERGEMARQLIEMGIATERGGRQIQVMSEMIYQLSDALDNGTTATDAFSEVFGNLDDDMAFQMDRIKSEWGNMWAVLGDTSGLMSGVGDFMGDIADIVSSLTTITKESGGGITKSLEGLSPWSGMAAGVDMWSLLLMAIKAKIEGTSYDLGAELGEAITAYVKLKLMSVPGLGPMLGAAGQVLGWDFTGAEETSPMLRAAQLVSPSGIKSGATEPTGATGAFDFYEAAILKDPYSVLSGADRIDMTQAKFDRVMQDAVGYLRNMRSAQASGVSPENMEYFNKQWDTKISTAFDSVILGDDNLQMLTGEKALALPLYQKAFPEEFKEPSFSWERDLSQGRFETALRQARAETSEVERVTGREFPLEDFAFAFKDGIEEYTMSNETLTRTMQLLNDTLTGTWNIPGGQQPWIPLPVGYNLSQGNSSLLGSGSKDWMSPAAALPVYGPLQAGETRFDINATIMCTIDGQRVEAIVTGARVDSARQVTRSYPNMQHLPEGW